MICPECQAQGQKSRVTSHGGSTTLIYYPPYYDEAGIYHHHDMNVVTESFSCSNDHRWVINRHPKCPGCMWPNLDEEAGNGKKRAAMILVKHPVKENLVLAVKEESGDVLLPGGHTEDGESIWSTAARGLKEETDLRVYVDDLLPIAKGHGIAEPDCEVTIFLARIVFGDEKPVERGTTLVWAEWKE